MQFPYSMKESVNISGELFLNQPNLIDEKGNVSSPFEKSNQSIEMKSSEHEWNSSVYFHRISSLRRRRENSIDNNDNSMHLLPLLMVSHSILEYLEKSSFTQMPIEIGWHVFQPRCSLAATALNWSVFIVVRVVVVVVTFFYKEEKRNTHKDKKNMVNEIRKNRKISRPEKKKEKVHVWTEWIRSIKMFDCYRQHKHVVQHWLLKKKQWVVRRSSQLIVDYYSKRTNIWETMKPISREKKTTITA